MAPRLLPLTLLLSALLWVFVTTGVRQIFVKEVLGGAYDSQAEHFLRGNVDVDTEAIGHEAMIVNGHARMYFGPFPALLRIPLNFIYPAGHGKWCRISGFFAGVIALFAFAGLVRIALCSSPLSPSARNWLGNACLVGFALGSPLLLLLGNLSIYNESIIWGLGLALGALFFALRSQHAEGSAQTRMLLGFSLCAGGALLSRVTFGAPFILIAPLLALRIRPENRTINFAALVLPVGAALVFYLCLSYARFGSFVGVNFDYYINSTHSEFAHKFGMFSPRRIPYSFADYFSVRLPSLRREPPFIVADRHPYEYLFSLFQQLQRSVYLSGVVFSMAYFRSHYGNCLSSPEEWCRRIPAEHSHSSLCPICLYLVVLFARPALLRRSLSFPDLLSRHFSHVGRSGLTPVALCIDRASRSLSRRELACDRFVANWRRSKRAWGNKSGLGKIPGATFACKVKVKNHDGSRTA